MPSAPTIAPYWTCFPSFFNYPLRWEPLWVCTAAGLLMALAEVLPGLFGALCVLVCFFASVRYGFHVLARTSQGHIDDVLLIFDEDARSPYLPYLQLLYYVAAVILAGVAMSVGGKSAALVVLVLCALGWPANTMVLVISQDVGESLTPTRLWQVAARIGLPYLGLCACLLLLCFGSLALLQLSTSHLPEWLHGLLGGFIGAYFAIVMYRLMGYVLYQYHQELDLDVRVGFEAQASPQSRDPRAAQTAQLAELLREGRGDEALAMLQEALRAAPMDVALNERMHRLLAALPGKQAALVQHARQWLPELLSAGRLPQALEVLAAVQAKEADFTLAAPSHLLSLAQAAFEARQYALATHLIRGFDHKHPGHAETAAVYLLGARLLLEHHRDEAQAERILQALKQHFPQHAAAQEADKLLQLIARLRLGGAAPQAGSR